MIMLSGSLSLVSPVVTITRSAFLAARRMSTTSRETWPCCSLRQANPVGLRRQQYLTAQLSQEPPTSARLNVLEQPERSIAPDPQEPKSAPFAGKISLPPCGISDVHGLHRNVSAIAELDAPCQEVVPAAALDSYCARDTARRS